MIVQDTVHGSIITQTLDTTIGKEISSALKHFSFMNEAKVDQIEDRLARTFNQCIDTHKLYEEELKKRHVQKQRIQELEGRVQGLETKVASLKDQLKNVKGEWSEHKVLDVERSSIDVEIKAE